MALNLGGLFFTLDADTRGLTDAQRRIETFARQVRRAWNGVGQGTVKLADAQALTRQERAIISALERIKRAQNSLAQAREMGTINTRGLREAEVTIARLKANYDDFVRAMTKKVPLGNLDFGRRVQLMNSQIGDATRNLRNLTNETRRGTDILHGFGSASLLVQGHLGGMSTRFFALTTLVRDFGAGIAIAAGTITGLAVGLGLLASGSIKAGMSLQQVEKQLLAVSGNAAVAQYHIKFIKDVADQAGISFNDTARSFARFLVSAQNGGLTLQETQEAFRGVALSAATMQLSVEDTQGVFRALDQMMSKGTVQAEELRGQLGDRLPGAFIAAAAAMGVNTRELNKMLKAGEVVSSEFVPKFVKAYMTMIGINPASSIQTLRAELNRAGNEWQYFLQGLNNATNATGHMTSIVSSLSNLLRTMTANMPTLIGYVGALTGAMIGLGVAMAMPAIFTFISNAILWTKIFIDSARAVGFLSAAMQVLNITMMANPLIRIITIIGTLAAAVIGAITGYKLFSNAVGNNNQALQGSLKFWNQYIEQQKAAGAQIRSVTADMYAQARAAAITQQATLAKSKGAMLAALSNVQRLQAEYDKMKASPVRGKAGLELLGATGLELGAAKKDLGNLKQNVRDQTTTMNELTKVLDGFGQTIKLPDVAGGGGLAAVAAGADKAGDSVDRITNRIKDLVDAARTAQRQLQLMIEPIAQGQDISQRLSILQDLGEAMRIVNNLSPKELGAAAGILGVPATVDAVTQAIAELVGQTRVANEALDEFGKILGDIQQGQRALASSARQMSYLEGLGFGEADPRQMRFLEELGKAEETLQKLANSGAAGQQAIASLSQYLSQAGVEGGNLAEQLANFNLQVAEAGERIRVWDDYLTKMRQLKDSIQDVITSQGALTGARGGNGAMFGLGSSFFAGDTADAIGRAIERGRTVSDMARQMQAVGMPIQQINEATERYLNLLRQVDEEKDVYARIEAEARRTQDALRSMVMEGLGGLRDFLTGVDSLSDAIQKLGERFLDIAWQNFVEAPITDMFSSMGRQRGNQAAAGIDTNIVNQTMQAIGLLGQTSKGTSDTMNTQLIQSIGSVVTSQFTQQLGTQAASAAMGSLTVAATAAAAALAAIAAAGGGGGGDDGGGEGLFGTLFKLGASIIGGSIGGGGSSYAGFSTDPIGDLFLGRALGGNMRAGTAYRINETGIKDGEYFIPKVNGYMSPRGPGGGGSTYIDASTRIDARGATRDAIVELREVIEARDRQLRSEIPFMVDSRVVDSTIRGRY